MRGLATCALLLILVGACAVETRADTITYELSNAAYVQGEIVVDGDAVGDSSFTNSNVVSWWFSSSLGGGFTLNSSDHAATLSLIFASGQIGDATITSNSGTMSFFGNVIGGSENEVIGFGPPSLPYILYPYIGEVIDQGGGTQSIRSQFLTAFRFDLQSVPEPTTLALFGLGAGALALRRRKRKLA